MSAVERTGLSGVLKDLFLSKIELRFEIGSLLFRFLSSLLHVSPC